MTGLFLALAALTGAAAPSNGPATVGCIGLTLNIASRGETLDELTRAVLDRFVAREPLRFSETRLAIVSYASPGTHSLRTNSDAARRRGEEVRAYLISRGVPPDRIRVLDFRQNPYGPPRGSNAAVIIEYESGNNSSCMAVEHRMIR